MSVLVIGGAGYIGSRLVQATGWDCLDLPHRYSELVDVADTVVFLAGHSDVAACNSDPIKSRINNVEDFEKFVTRTKQLIFASTMLVYGDGSHDESSLMLPASTYARQKLEAERLCNGKTVLRFGVVCGASPNPKPTLLNKMVADAKTGLVSVCGREFWRPVLGIGDVCRAIIAAVNNYQPGTYNLHSFNVKIAEAGEYVAKKFKAKLDVQDSLSHGIQLSSTKFYKAFSFAPQDTLESIVKELS